MSTDDPAVNLHVVRNLRSDRTHVMHITRTTTERIFGVQYQRPSADKAACGVLIGEGVVMRAGATVTCGPCAHVTGIRFEGDPA